MLSPSELSTLPSELLAHLDAAKAIANRLTTGGSSTNGGTGFIRKELYQAAEQRANTAEAQVSRLKRELAALQGETSLSQQELQRLAYQDPLTGLANANLIEEHLRKLLGCKTSRQQLLLLLIDLDHFSTINHTLGQELGDELLVRVGERLLELPGNDTAVGRLAEDEFALVLTLPTLSDVNNHALSMCQKVRELLTRPFVVQGQNITLTVSQGGVSCQGPDISARELLDHARIALVRAKRSGRDQTCLYSSDLERNVRRNATLEFQLKYALENDELFFEYLPILWLDKSASSSVSGRLIGVEALLRWRHRVEGVLEPQDFLQAAERSGQIVAIGEKMLKQACLQQRAWHRQGLDLFLNINLSGRQLLATNIAEVAAQECDQIGVPRERLTFEFSEFLSSFEEIQIEETISKLRSAGFSLAMDNFGDTSCSLRLLSQVQFLKLSPRLVRTNPELCRKALSIAASLGLIAVAVGVETARTAQFMIDNGCPTVQGFFFSRPLDADGVQRLSASSLTWAL